LIEAPVGLPEALDAADSRPVLVDCLTLWLTNLMLGEHDVAASIATLESALRRRDAPTILVSNEVGLGIIPENALGRAFRDEAGRLNQRIAALAGHVVFMISGLPMILK
jgi:adenosyl cobinamide kinase/adenosyl cobinamide phosphate guanylyltransferase